MGFDKKLATIGQSEQFAIVDAAAGQRMAL